MPVKFPANQIILRKNARPDEVFFILKGNVLNSCTERVYSTGCIVGETDIFYGKRDRQEEYVTLNKAFALKMDAHTFE